VAFEIKRGNRVWMFYNSNKFELPKVIIFRLEKI
jgi:hypothetical protein